MAVYHLVLHTFAAIATLSTMPSDRGVGTFTLGFSLSAVCSGWIAFLLFIFQIYLSTSLRTGRVMIIDQCINAQIFYKGG